MEGYENAARFDQSLYFQGGNFLRYKTKITLSALTLISLVLSGCSSAEVEDSVVSPSPSISPSFESAEEEVEPKPVAESYLASELIEFSVDEDGGWLIQGNMTMKYQITNVSEVPVLGLATTLRVTTKEGELLFLENLNQEIEILPGESIEFGRFGETKLPLIAAIPQLKSLLELESPSEDAVVELEVRKILLEGNSILEFVSEVPSEELNNENE